MLFTTGKIPGIINFKLYCFCLISLESMNFSDCLNKMCLGLRRAFLNISSLAVISFGIILPWDLYAVCPTPCTNDFFCINKGMDIEKVVIDDFDDGDTPFGIVSKDSIVTKKAEDEVKAIMDEDPAELKQINTGELLAELQKEGNIYLGQNFGIGPRISLEESIYLALKDNEGVGFGAVGVNGASVVSNTNQGITTAYLQREQQMQTLKVAENLFRPQWDTTLNINYAQTNFRDRPHSFLVTLPAPGITTFQRLKTGGTINMAWTNTYTYGRIRSGAPSDTIATTSLNLNLVQPLLKGGGFLIGTMPLTRAYLNEETNINNLKATVIDVVTQTITTYRAYKQAIDQFEIDKRSIEEARKDLEKTKLLVEAGIRARADIVEGEFSLASREFSFQDSQNAVDQARIAFLRVLNMDTSLNLVPDNIFIVDIDPKDLPTVEELLAIAYLNDPGYLNQLISLRQSELTYILARNDLLWQLDFNAGITAGATRSSLGRSNQNSWDFRDRTVNTGLTLTIPFNRLGPETGLIDAKVGLRIARINVQKAEQDKTRDIKNKLREIKKNIIQVKLARLNVLLSKQRLVQKRIEIDAGSSSSFELTSILDQFINTETQELNAEIALMNSLSDMDALIGTTLDTWGIDINRRTENIPKLSQTLLGKIKVEK